MGVQTRQWLHHLKKKKGKNLVLHTQAENGFFPFGFLTMLYSYRLVAVRMSTNRPKMA